jgi:hypothetical protein
VFNCTAAYRFSHSLSSDSTQAVESWPVNSFLETPFPASLGVRPYEQRGLILRWFGEGLQFSRPVAHLVRDLDVRDLPLWNYSREGAGAR